ncbi:MAG: glycosyltransferase family 4 protein [Phycisphaerae bacterium]
MDIRIARGATLAIAYLPLLALAAYSLPVRRAYILALIANVLTIADAFLSPPSVVPVWMTINNRALTIVSSWIIIWVLHRSGRRFYARRGAEDPAAELDAPDGNGDSFARQSLDASPYTGTLHRARPTIRGRAACQRIAIIAHADAPWTAPYAQHFRAAGRDVRLISFHPDRIPGVESVFVGAEPFHPNRHKRLFLTRVPRVRRLLHEFRPDAVLACYIISNGLTAALAWGGPLVVSARGAGVLRQTRRGAPGPPTPLRARVLRFICQHATRVHTVSDEIRDALLRMGVPAWQIACFPLGVDPKEFALAAPPLRPADVPRLICTRRHERVYDIPTLIQAISHLRERGVRVHCTFVGGGDRMEEHRALAGRLKVLDRVEFLGRRPYPELPELLASAHLYVSASHSDGTSSSLLEALSVGLYPVVSDIPANRAWVRPGETGLLFPVGDSRQLANAIEEAISDPDHLARAARDNHAQVEHRGDRRAFNAQMLELVDEAFAEWHAAQGR